MQTPTPVSECGSGEKNGHCKNGTELNVRKKKRALMFSTDLGTGLSGLTGLVEVCSLYSIYIQY